MKAPRFHIVRSHRLVVAVAVAAFVFAARVWLIGSGGSVVPYWDQWEVEALSLYPHWLDGSFSCSELWSPHNEHRIALTRVADLLLFSAGGGWNPWTQMILNALLHALTAAGLTGLFWASLDRRGRTIWAVALALVFSSPAGWQNALWGFQSQVYFSNSLAVCAVGGLCAAPTLKSRWWSGWLAAAIALFANAGGVLISIAILGVNVSSSPTWRQSWREWIALVLIGVVLAFGWVLRVETSGHATLHAQSPFQFWATFSRCLAWPHVNHGLLIAVMQLPLIGLAIDRFRRKVSLDHADRCALALGLFTWLHAAAVAYTRAGGLPESRPLSRYQDPLLLGTAAQAFAAVRLAFQSLPIFRLGLAAWLAVLAAGLIILTETNLTLNLPYKRVQDTASLSMIRDYVRAGDPGIFRRDPDLPGPHPDPEVVRRVLDHPPLRAILPAGLLDPATDGRPPWALSQGGWLTLLAGGNLIVILIRAWRTEQPVNV